MKNIFTILLFFAIVFVQFAFSQIPTEGLVAYYPFNGNANDESGNGNNGSTNEGVTWVADRKGNLNSACYFNGTNAYINIPNSTSIQLPSNQLTFSLWFKCIATPDIVVPFFTKNNSTTELPQYTFHLNPIDVIRFGITDTSNNLQWIDNSYPFQLNQWYFIAVSWDGNTAKIFVNNTLISTHSFNVQMKSDTHPLEIGRDTGGLIEYYQGVMDEIRIYNRSLSEEEIQELYNETGGSLIAYYPFNGDADDESGNGNNGNVFGATLSEDRFGNLNSAYYFNGLTDSIQVNNSASLNPSYLTIAVWVNYEGASYNGHIVSKGLEQYDLFVETSIDDGISGHINNIDIRSQVALPFNTWSFLTIVKDQDSIYLYENGQLIKTKSLFGTINSSQNNLLIGRHPQDNNSKFQGKIDDIRIYNRELSNQEILDLYHEGGWTGGSITPVIFIPGIMGSPLYNDINDPGHLTDNERVWIKVLSNLDVLRLAEDGEAPFDEEYQIEVSPIRGDAGNTIRNELDPMLTGQANLPLSKYYDLVHYLETELNYDLDVDTNTTAQKNLFVFTYDWRKSINYNSERLSEFVQNVLSWTSSQQVNLICHSMGGLIAKKLINNLGSNTNIIRKIIFVGTPHLGVPKALYVTLTGDLLFPFTIYTTYQILRFSRNFPSGYTLFPTESYFDTSITNGYSNNVEGYSKTFRELNEPPMNYNSIKTFFKDVIVHPDIFNYYTFNDTLIDSAYNTHQDLENIDFGNIEVYNIVGYKKPTIGAVIYLNIYDVISKTFFLGNLSGDGTVPLRSAELLNNSINIADSTYYITNQWTLLGGTADHTALPGNEAVLEIIGGLLSEPTYKGPFNNPDIAQNYPLTYSVNVWQIIAGSPVEVHAYDYIGNHTGPTSDSTWEENIPDSYFLISSINDPNSSKGIILNSNEPVIIKIISRDTSASFNLHLNEINNGYSNVEVIFDSVITMPNTVATCSLDVLNSALTLLVDYDGDGIIDTSIIPTSVTDIGANETIRAPNKFYLSQNYPNPFNPSTTITYSIPQNQRVTLKVFDVLGNEVATLVNEEKPAGNYEVNFNAGDLASGIYFYKLQAGNFVQTHKMILLK